MTPIVSVRDLRMSYGGTDVLTGVDFDIGAGEEILCPMCDGAGLLFGDESTTDAD